MIEHDERIEADRVTRDREVLDEQTVRKRQERVDRVAWRPAVPAVEVEGRELVVWFAFQHALELLEEEASRRSFNAEQRRGRGYLLRLVGKLFQPREDEPGRLDG